MRVLVDGTPVETLAVSGLPRLYSLARFPKLTRGCSSLTSRRASRATRSPSDSVADQNGYEARLHAAAAYQSPNARLGDAEHGHDGVAPRMNRSHRKRQPEPHGDERHRDRGEDREQQRATRSPPSPMESPRAAKFRLPRFRPCRGRGRSRERRAECAPSGGAPARGAGGHGDRNSRDASGRGGGRRERR